MKVVNEPLQKGESTWRVASSGRVLAGWVENGKMSYQEVYRFDNEQKRVN